MAQAVSCQVCGVLSDPTVDGDPPLTWVMDKRPDGRMAWTCPRCAAQHVRSMEAKLDAEWW